MRNSFNSDYNLPPGCRLSDIPGNRPIDEAYDHWLENFEDERMDTIRAALDDNNWDEETAAEIRRAIADERLDSIEIEEEFGLGSLPSWDSVFDKWHETKDEPDEDQREDR